MERFHTRMMFSVLVLIGCMAVYLTACTVSEQDDLISEISTPTIAQATAKMTMPPTESRIDTTIPATSSNDPGASATPKPDVHPDCAAGVIIFRTEYGGGITQLYAICPDGTSLVEVSPEDNWVEQYLNYSDLRVVIKNIVDYVPVEMRYATLSFDEKYVAYGFVAGYDAYGLNIINVETKTNSTIIEPDNDDSPLAFSLDWLSWSPTSYQLLFHGRTAPLQVLNITCDDTSHICNGKVVGNAGKFVEISSIARWSPDGTLIAYPCYTANQVDDSIEFKHSVCIQNTSGNILYEFEDITLGLSEIGTIHWAPDATQVAFHANLQGHSDSDVFLLSLPDGELINLTENMPGDQSLFFWKP